MNVHQKNEKRDHCLNKIMLEIVSFSNIHFEVTKFLNPILIYSILYSIYEIAGIKPGSGARKDFNPCRPFPIHTNPTESKSLRMKNESVTLSGSKMSWSRYMTQKWVGHVTWLRNELVTLSDSEMSQSCYLAQKWVGHVIWLRRIFTVASAPTVTRWQTRFLCRALEYFCDSEWIDFLC